MAVRRRMSKNRTAAGTLGSQMFTGIYTRAGRVVVSAAINLCLGLLFARATVFGGYAPFGVAAVAAACGSDGLFMLCGAGLGYLLPGGAQYPVKYLAAAAAVFLLQWLLSGRKRTGLWMDAGVASLSLLVCSGAIVAGNGLQPKEIVYCLAETMLCGCAVVFLKPTLPLIRKPSKLWGISQRQMVCMTISLCMLLLAFEGVKFDGISLGRVLGVLAVLIAARYGREAAGSVTGVAVGILLSFGDKDMAQVLAGYGFGGLITGVFSPLGRFGCAVAFILANSVAGLYLGNAENVVLGLYEVMIATVIFMLLPERWMVRLSVLFTPAARDRSPARLREEMSARMTGAAGVLEEIAQTMMELTGRLRKINAEDISTVFTDASDISCVRCGMRNFCWQTAYSDTMDAFNNMSETLRQTHELTRADAPEHFASRCCRLGELLNAVNKCYAEFIARKSGDNRALMLRRVLSEQYGAFAGLLRDMSGEFTRSARKNLAGAESVRAALADCGMEVGESFCQMDSRGRILVEASIAAAGRTRVSRNELVGRLSKACGRELSEPVVVTEGDVLRVSLTEKPSYTVKFSQAVIPKDGEQLCGDSCESFLDGNGRALMIVSDGMGCGGSAAVESQLASTLMSRMLHAGFGFDTAMNVANSAMMMKSNDESFATFDIAAIDLYSGRAEFLKAGAPPSYVRRSGRAERVTENSMPAGILQGARLERTEARLSRGDLVVLVSDGVAPEDDAWLLKELEQFDGGNLRAFTGALARKAKELRTDGHDDDITVLAAMVH